LNNGSVGCVRELQYIEKDHRLASFKWLSVKGMRFSFLLAVLVTRLDVDVFEACEFPEAKKG